ERRRDSQERRRTARYPYLRPGRTRAAGQAVHAHRLARTGGAVTMAKIKKGDLVVVISGRDKGQQGRVLEVLTDTNRVLVERVQRMQRDTKGSQTQRRGGSGGMESKEALMHVSDVMLGGAEKKKGARVGSRTEEVERDGRSKTAR